MRIRELVKYLHLENTAPFHFDTDISKREYATCKHMTEEELNDYEKNIWTSEKVYDNRELGIYLADITVDELYQFEKNRNPISVNKTIDDISYIFPVKIKEYAIIFSIYVVLHEVGHWLNFKASGMTNLEYSLWDSDFRLEPSRLASEIYRMPDYSYEKRKLAEKQVEMYKNIPSEKAADMYAHKHIKEKFDLIRPYISELNDYS